MKHRTVARRLGGVRIIGCCITAGVILACHTTSAQQYLRGDRPPPVPSGSPSLHFPPVIPLPFPSPRSGPPPDENESSSASATAPPTAEELLKNGPRFPPIWSTGSFDVVGFTRAGWPYVIDFSPKPNSCTWVQVDSEEATPWRAILDPDGHAGRHIVQLGLPPMVGKEARPAHYVVYSVDKPCTANGADRAFSPIDVFAMGAGPRAVGSMAINSVRFGPFAPRFPEEAAFFGYVAENDFARIAEEILDFRATGPGRWTVLTVRATDLFAPAPGQHDGRWDGTRRDGKRAPGIYRLQIRAWNTMNDEKSWVGAVSPSSVHVSTP